MTQMRDNIIMDIEENNESYDATNHQEALEQFHATMDQRNHTNTTASRIIQSDSIMQMDMNHDDDDNSSHMAVSTMEQQPQFPKLTLQQQQGPTSKYKIEYRRIRCPSHRYTPLREHWEQILTPLVEYLKLQVREKWQIVTPIVCWKRTPNEKNRMKHEIS
jgi:hypothetical protein